MAKLHTIKWAPGDALRTRVIKGKEGEDEVNRTDIYL